MLTAFKTVTEFVEFAVIFPRRPRNCYCYGETVLALTPLLGKWLSVSSHFPSAPWGYDK